MNGKFEDEIQGDKYIMEEESGKKYKSIDFLCAES